MATTKTPPKIETLQAAPSEKYAGLTRRQLIDIYRLMYVAQARRIARSCSSAAEVFFRISARGTKRLLVAAGMVLRPSYDWFIPIIATAPCA